MNYSFKSFQKNAIIRLLSLDKYKYLMENLDKINEKKYQNTFNSFYRVRRNEEWQNKFYTYFEKIQKNKNVSFGEILKYIYNETGQIEASFCSKMLATINPEMPIWDQYILKNLKLDKELSLSYGTKKDARIKKTIELYNMIVEKENELLKDNSVQQTIKEFKECFSEYNLSDIKILDYIMWNNR